MKKRRFKRMERYLKPCPICGEPMRFDVNNRAEFITLDCINTDCPVMPFVPIARSTDKVNGRALKFFAKYWNYIFRGEIERGFYQNNIMAD